MVNLLSNTGRRAAFPSTRTKLCRCQAQANLDPAIVRIEAMWPSVAPISKFKAGERGRRKDHKANSKATGVTVKNLLAAKGPVARLGGVEAAKEALEQLAKLLD